MNDRLASFDLDAYAVRYHGRGKIQRLRFIAQRSPELAVDALRAAVDEARKGIDTLLYKDILLQAEGRLGIGYEQDDTWIRESDKKAVKEMEKYRTELEQSKQHGNKEVIRIGHDVLGDFYHRRGKLVQARGDYIKTREYCTHPRHSLQMCMKVIIVSIEAGEYAHVENHYLMAENIQDVDKKCPEMAKMKACAGLAMLVRGNYLKAATLFLAANMDANEEKIALLQKDFGDVMSLEDVATYGCLCALATLSRSALRKNVIEKPEFRSLLELVPDIREIIYDFYHTRYTRCLETMDKIRPELTLDMHLGKESHVEMLYRLIRRKALVQYVSPFISADLCRMQAVFNTTSAELEEELLGLIETGAIQARIDTQNNALHGKKTNPRITSLSDSLQKGQDAFDEAEAMLLRMNLLKNSVEISSPSMSRAGNAMGARGPSLSSVVDNIFDRNMRTQE